MLSMVRRSLEGVVDMVYPRLCEVCGKPLTRSEQYICLGCELSIPFTDCHLSDFNLIHQRLATRPPIQRAASMFYYIHDDPYIKLIHKAKYDGRPEIMRYLTTSFASTLRSTGFFDGIDAVQPIPMHWFKALRRGYNQTDIIASAISEIAGLEVVDCLKVVRRHSTQTRKGRLERWLNAKSSYGVRNTDAITGKHILLVDDVITTGSTIRVCAETLAAATPGLKISVLSLGLTRQN